MRILNENFVSHQDDIRYPIKNYGITNFQQFLRRTGRLVCGAYVSVTFCRQAFAT